MSGIEPPTYPLSGDCSTTELHTSKLETVSWPEFNQSINPGKKAKGLCIQTYIPPRSTAATLRLGMAGNPCHAAHFSIAATELVLGVGFEPTHL